MPIKTILCYLPEIESAPELIRFSAAVSDRMEAHLVGLHLLPTMPPRLPMYGVGQVPIPQEVFKRREAELIKRAENIQTVFKESTSDCVVQPEWQNATVEYEDFGDYVVHQSRFCDLTIVGSNTKDLLGPGAQVPTRIAMESGRPVLIAPLFKKMVQPIKNIVVAWNNSREAARAVFDAVPFMKVAERVDVLEVRSSSILRTPSPASGEDVAVSLARHGVNAEVETVGNASGGIGAEILKRAGGGNYDLLVMGCYGHSRIREMIFGGATRAVLEELPVPVLMSH